MTLSEIIQKMEMNPWALTKGKGSLSKNWHCSEEDIVRAKQIIRNKTKNKKLPKVLIFDIETSPMKAYIWSRWKQNVYLDLTISEWFVICWSAKWLYSNEVMSGCVTPEEVLKEDDKRIVEDLWKLFDEADIIIAHNGSHFDIPKMNSRFLIHGLNPPSSYFTIDTAEVARKYFGFSSNKLDALAGYFDIPHKMDTEFELWKKCLEGNLLSLNYMVEYNKRDVEILEQVYLRLRPYIKNHPNISNITDTTCCTHCGSDSLEILNGKYYHTAVNKFQLYRCKKCGAIIRGRKNLQTNVNFTSTSR